MPPIFRSFVLLTLGARAFAAPVITQQPIDVVEVQGQLPGFYVAATGTGTLSYQWFKNGTALTTEFGATTNQCFLSPVGLADAGAEVKVRVTDSTGATESAVARIALSSASSQDVLPRPDPATARYHLDAVNGNDTTGDGSPSRPFRTVARVRPLLRGGELVLLHEGSYDEIAIDATVNGHLAQPYTDWVSFMAAPGAAPVVARACFRGYWGNPADWNGSLEMRVRLIGLTCADGVSINGVNLVRVEQCTLRSVGPTTGSSANLSKRAVLVRRARSITIEDCEITQTAVGITARGNDLTFRRNHIHHNAHDGINLTGCDFVLIEGNWIHELDDGVDDGEASWSVHVDGIQAYMETDGVPIAANRHITIRGNRIYHVESMALMLQNRNDARYAEGYRDVFIAEDWVVENNVFGGTAGYMIHGKFFCLGFRFRHNSIVYLDNDHFQVQGRVVAALHYDVSLPTYLESSGVEVYNNIFCGLDRSWSAIDGNYTTRYDRNLFYHATGVAQPKGLDPVITDLVPFADASQFDGALALNSPAIDVGSTLNPAPTDLVGAPRDRRPDIGAREFGGPDSYAAWAIAAGLAGAGSARSADPDGDGLCNLIEYALRTDPLRPSGTQLPAPALAAGPGGPALSLTHRHNKTAALTVGYEASADLVSWAAVPLAPTVVNTDPDGDGRTELLRLLVPVGTDSRRFLRMVVQEP